MRQGKAKRNREQRQSLDRAIWRARGVPYRCGGRRDRRADRWRDGTYGAIEPATGRACRLGRIVRLNPGILSHRAVAARRALGAPCQAPQSLRQDVAVDREEASPVLLRLSLCLWIPRRRADRDQPERREQPDICSNQPVFGLVMGNRRNRSWLVGRADGVRENGAMVRSA